VRRSDPVATLERDIEATEKALAKERNEARQHGVVAEQAEAEKHALADAEVDGRIDEAAALAQLEELDRKRRRQRGYSGEGSGTKRRAAAWLSGITPVSNTGAPLRAATRRLRSLLSGVTCRGPRPSLVAAHYRQQPPDSVREGAEQKGRRYLVEGRLVVERVDEHGIEARCRGGGAVYKLGIDDGCWFCSCPARSLCCHLIALGPTRARRGGPPAFSLLCQASRRPLYARRFRSIVGGVVVPHPTPRGLG
jgi:hypothetical protein